MHYIVIVLLTFIQTLVLNQMMGLSVLEASPFTIRLWCNYLAAALILWSPMLFTDKKRWTYLIAILLDVWFIGNLMYFRSYGDVLNRWCLQNVSNMDGIWSSVLPFLQWKDIIFPGITIVWIIFCETVHHEHSLSLWKRISIALAAFLVCCTPQTLIHKKAELPLLPFDSYYADLSMGRMWYMHSFGALTHLGNETVNLISQREEKVTPVSNGEVADYLLQPGSIAEQGNLLIIIFESLEDRVIGMQINGQEVTPCINQLTAHPMTGHYPMMAQVKEGKSSDAQLMIFNGLLPIKNGATSMRYANNEYPSLVSSSRAKTKRLFAAYPYHMWNQKMNAESYGFDSVYAEDVSDRMVADRVISSILHDSTPFICTMVTMASHSPFMLYADSSSLQIDPSPYDAAQTRYLQCVHYTDSAIGRVIDRVLTDSVLAATTRIVITGDHPFFSLESPVPFILYDPFCVPCTVTRPLYQIDIYSTLIERMHIATPWHGLGKNISDSCAYTPEQIKELESLSDRIIRTNYFKSNL